MHRQVAQRTRRKRGASESEVLKMQMGPAGLEFVDQFQLSEHGSSYHLTFKVEDAGDVGCLPLLFFFITPKPRVE